MKFDKLVNLVNKLPYFDLPLLVQLSREPKRQIIVQLHQWATQGKILRLRRGLYTLADVYRGVRLDQMALANELYKPSYLSGLLALSLYDLVPEKIVTYTSVTTRVPRIFKNPLGTFAYYHLKKEFFWGFILREPGSAPVRMAESEKALLDYFHLNEGEWTPNRLEEMRFQNFEQINTDKLAAYAKKWGSPRLERAVNRFLKTMSHEKEGMVEV